MTDRLIGQEVMAFCGKCKEETIHSITACSESTIEKVMCKICSSYHKYKKIEEKKSATKSKKEKTKRTKSRYGRSKIGRILDESTLEDAIDYKISNSYNPETPINHKKFGLGVVKNVIDPQKIAVLFEDGERILVQNIQK